MATAVSAGRGNVLARAAALSLLAPPLTAAAHGFGRLYNLPVPFWMYGWAAASALLLSFLLIGYFASTPSAHRDEARQALRAIPRGLRFIRPLLQTLSLMALLLCIVAGLIGNRDPYRNFSMTCFWIVFVLGFTYFTAFAGNLYAAINPWRTLAALIDRIWRGYARGRFIYPTRLGNWPALVLYMGFIGFELFGHSTPFSLAALLLGYSGFNLIGVGLFGSTHWFRHVEFFSLFLRLVALMAPVEYQRGALRWRLPFSGLWQERPTQLATVLFALAMLSTTAFDGLRATQWWVALFWWDPTGWVTALAGTRPGADVARMLDWYFCWESFWLLASPFLYFALYLAALAIARVLTGSTRSLRELALDFGYSLLPIALVYHATHYSTLLLTQGLKIVSLLSDPFGWRWNLLGTANKLVAPILPPMGWVWHTQVGLILFGHIVSVYVAHRIALRVFPTPRQAWLSQLPMLLMMVAFTVAGLWILAQPLTVELMR